MNTNNESVRDARSRYFKENNFGSDGGYTQKWVYLKFGPVSIPVYNSSARRRAVPLHDLHHLVTQYPTTPKGEAQIASWEIAAGTHDKWFALLINLPALMYGFALWPGDCAAAWRQGKRSSSLYRFDYSDELLDLSVDELCTLTQRTNEQKK